MSESQSDVSGSKTDEEVDDIDAGDALYDDTMNQEVDKQYVLEKIDIFRMIHEDKCEDGKSITADARVRSLNEIKSLYDALNLKMSLEVYIDRVLGWKSYRKDLKYWETWDKKEEFIRNNSRSRERENDRIRSRNRRNNDDYRSRSRSRGRDRSRERERNEDDNNNDKRRKERVK